MQQISGGRPAQKPALDLATSRTLGEPTLHLWRMPASCQSAHCLGPISAMLRRCAPLIPTLPLTLQLRFIVQRVWLPRQKAQHCHLPRWIYTIVIMQDDRAAKLMHMPTRPQFHVSSKSQICGLCKAFGIFLGGRERSLSAT